MKYLTLRKAFHDPNIDSDFIYEQRFNSPDAIHLDFAIAGSQAFFVLCPDIYKHIVLAARLDKEILRLTMALPSKALEDYVNSCLIDEVVLTNEIEGVNSSRREIGDVLEGLRKKDKKGRFYGIVSKYLLLQEGSFVPLDSCEEVRHLYDDLMLDEVVSSDKGNAPDGQLFRRDPVSVYDPSGRTVHTGITPESEIIKAMDRALRILDNQELDAIVRVSLFHFLFGFIHPFYDGNGRTNRFISSYALAQEYEPIIGYRLSYAIKEQIEAYYKGFTTCEHALNKGDLTPFVLMFSKIVVNAMESMRDSLRDREEQLDLLDKALPHIDVIRLNKGMYEFASVLTQAALFSSYGITTAELERVFSLSKPTVYKRLDILASENLVVKTQVGHKVYYMIDANQVLEHHPGE